MSGDASSAEAEYVAEFAKALAHLSAGESVPPLPVEGAPPFWADIHGVLNQMSRVFATRSAELAARDCRFRAMFEHSAIGMVVSREGVILECNAAYAENLGYSLSELRGASLVELTHPDDREATRGFIGQQTSCEFEKRYIRKDGGVVWVHVVASYAPALIAQGGNHSFAFIYDITEQKRAAAELRAKDQKLQVLFEEGSDAIYVFAFDGRIAEANRQAEQLLQATREQLIGSSIQDVLVGGLDPAIPQRLADGVTLTRQLRMRRTDGSIFPAEARLRRLDLDDGGLIIGSVRDVTEREQHAHLKQRFIQGVVAVQEEERTRVARELHDALGQRLTSLSVRLTSLASESEGESRSRIIELRGECESAIGEVASLAYRLRPPALDDLGLGVCIEECAREFTRHFGIPMDVHLRGLGERLPPGVETALYRIVQEALTNVVRHAQASFVSLVLDRSSSAIRLIVEDDGRGFDRASGAGSGNGRFGFGLTGMHERASLLGGTVDIESSPCAGTTIYVTVPL